MPTPDHRLEILTLMVRFLPQYRTVGPMRSMSQLVARLAASCHFTVITLDRPVNGQAPLTPTAIAGSTVYAMGPGGISWGNLRRLVRLVPHDLIYLNSAFAMDTTIKVLVLRRLSLLPSKRPIVVAPRGEFCHGALNHKGFRKNLFLWLAKALGLYRGVHWQATSEMELVDIQRCLGPAARVTLARNLSTLPEPTPGTAVRNPKQRQTLKVIFLSRLSPNKNLAMVLSVLQACQGQIELNIYGHPDQDTYWQQCQVQMQALPPQIKVTYHGILPPDQVLATFAQHHLFFFPTLWENFGHVIMESLTAGCPVLISDRTPWRDLARQGIGWEFPLDQAAHFQETVQGCLAMDEAEFRPWSDRARAFGQAYAADPQPAAAHLALFRQVAGKA
jgi:glycosyltransferase involved in cell wall biosynthesis